MVYGQPEGTKKWDHCGEVAVNEGSTVHFKAHTNAIEQVKISFGSDLVGALEC